MLDDPETISNAIQHEAWYILFLSGLLAYLFVTLSTAAFDFLGPTIRHLSVKTGLPDAIIGVTFLAFGNASADIASAFSAINSGSPALAIGSAIGAAMFVCGVGAGLVGIVGGPFAVSQSQLMRDLIFLLIAVGLLLLTVADGVMTVYEAVVMLLVYAAYATVLVNYQRFEAITGDCSPTHSSDEESGLASPLVVPQLHIETNLPAAYRPQRNRSSVLSAIEPRHAIYSISSSRHGSTPLLNVPSAFTLSPTSQPELARAASPYSPSGLSERELTLSPLWTRDPPVWSPSKSINGRDEEGNLDGAAGDADTNETFLLPPRMSLERSVSPCQSIQNEDMSESELDGNGGLNHARHIYRHFLPSLVGWSSKPIWQKITSILMTPAIFVLTLTIPVSEEDIDVSLLRIHAVVCPIAFYILIAPSSLVLGILMLLVSFAFGWAAFNHPERIHNFACTLVGFFMSVAWVMLLAQLLVKLVKEFEAILGWSEAALGLIIISLGNSAGDILSNLALVREQHAAIALGGSFASPLLNMLLGLGGSSLIVMAAHRSSSIALPTSAAILSTGLCLMVCLCTFIVMLSISGWNMTRTIGIVGVGFWLVSWALTLYLSAL